MDLVLMQNNPELKKEKHILELIFMKKAISRPELLKLSRLKIATLYRIIDDLAERGMVLIQKGDEANNVGRPSDILYINGAYAYVFTISVQRFNFNAALIDFSGNIILRQSFPCNKETKPETIVNTLYTTYVSFLEKMNISEEKVLGLSLVTFGIPSFPQQAAGGGKIHYPVYPGFAWNAFDKTGALEQIFKKKVRFDFNARAAAWGNYVYRYQNEVSSLAYIIINEGIGTGVIVKGRIIEGGQRIVNGLGHMVVDINGQKCPCGKYGCIETRASETAIYQNFLAELRLGKDSVLAEQEDSLCCSDIIEAADNGDPLAAYVIENSASIFSIGLENYLNILEIELIVLGGAVPTKSKLFCDTIRKRLKLRFPKMNVVVELNEEEILLKGSASAFLLLNVNERIF